MRGGVLRWMLRRLGVLVLLLFLAAPAVAAPLGQLDVSGTWTLPDGTLARAPLAGVFLDPDAAPTRLSVTAEQAQVKLFQRTSVDAAVANPGLAPRETSYALTNVTFILLPGSFEGWLGLAPTDATLTRSAAGSVEGRATGAQRLGNGVESVDPEDRGFFLPIDEPHLVLRAAGRLVVEGAFALKFQGPDFDVHAAENASTISTWARLGPGGVGAREDRWAYVSFERATLELEHERPLDVHVPAAEAAWDGRLRAKVVEGSLQTSDGTFLATGEPAVLDGAFLASITPLPGAAATSRMLLSGELASTTLAAAATATPGSRGTASTALWGVGLLAVGVVVGVLGQRHLRRAGRLPAYGVEDFARLATQAAEAEDYPSALEWIRKARALAPTSVRLALDEGFYLEQTGEVSPALEAYADAAMRGSDGEGEFLAGMLEWRLGEKEAAAGWFSGALAKTPSLVMELEEMAPDALLHPHAREAVRRAREALDE